MKGFKQQALTRLTVCCSCAQFVRELLQKSSAVARDSYSIQGVGQLLLTDPTVDEPGNIIDGMLHYRLYGVSSATGCACARTAVWCSQQQQQLQISSMLTTQQQHCDQHKHCCMCCGMCMSKAQQHT